MYITLFPAWAAGVASRNPLARHLLIGVIICSDEWNEQKRYSTTNRKWGIKRVYIPSPSKSPFVLMTCIKTAACLIMTSSAVRAGFDFRAHIQYAREQYSMRMHWKKLEGGQHTRSICRSAECSRFPCAEWIRGTHESTRITAISFDHFDWSISSGDWITCTSLKRVSYKMANERITSRSLGLSKVSVETTI